MKREQRATTLEDSKKSIKRFEPQVRQLRRSTQIDFVREETAFRGTTALTSTTPLVKSTVSENDFESEFRQAVEESGMNWADNSTSQLPVSAPVERDRERQQLARIRTLLRADQIRARRLKRIKSKTYRRLLRKKELKGMADLIAKVDKDDPDAAEQIRSELQAKLSNVRLNRQRQARMKWSKAAQRFGGIEMRYEISKQAQAEADEKRELVKAVKGRSRSSSDTSDSDITSEESDDSDIVARVKKTISQDVSEKDDRTRDGGLFKMQFMRDAATKQRELTEIDAHKFVEILEEPLDGGPEDRSNDSRSESDSEKHDQAQLVASLFSASHSEKPTNSGESRSVLKPEVRNQHDGIPGWGNWIGDGVKDRRKEKRRATANSGTSSKRQSALVHLTPETELRAPLMKYQVDHIPYPFRSRAEFEAANNLPVGSDWMSITAHLDTIQPKVNTRIGTVAPPIKLAKHLDADKRAKLINAWDTRKKSNPTKARFV